MGSPLGDAAAEVLRRVYGYDTFRGQQQEIIEHVCAGGDAVALMPTGSGKSLCYQIPAQVREGTGVVISPLIALMQDQVDALNVLELGSWGIQPACWEDLSLVVAWRQFMRDPQAFFRHLFEA